MAAKGLVADQHDQQTYPLIWLSRMPALYMPRQLAIQLLPAPAEAVADKAEPPALNLNLSIAQLTHHRHSGRLHPKALRLADYEAHTLGPAPTSPSVQRLPSAARAAVEPLTAREQDILRAAASGLSNSEIAAQRRLTTGTVKWHLNNIYGKLGVRRRTQAIASARELGYLPA